MLKWQLLLELLNCSIKMTAVRSSCGAVRDARLQCLEALKLAVKLKALSQYVHTHVDGFKKEGTRKMLTNIFLLLLFQLILQNKCNKFCF